MFCGAYVPGADISSFCMYIPCIEWYLGHLLSDMQMFPICRHSIHLCVFHRTKLSTSWVLSVAVGIQGLSSKPLVVGKGMSTGLGHIVIHSVTGIC